MFDRIGAGMLKSRMLDNIQPISTGNGLVAHYTSNHGSAFFALVISDPQQPKKALEDIAAAHEQVIGLRRNLTSNGDPVTAATQPLKGAFNEPQRVKLKNEPTLER